MVVSVITYIKKPGEIMNSNSKRITVVAIFASLYTITVGIFAFMSFTPFQARLADALLPLSMIFGIPSIVGFGLGALVSNFLFGGLGIIDIIGGATANFLACSLAYYIAKRKGVIFRFIGTLVETLVISFIVGGYLSLLFFDSLVISISGVLIGSTISIILIGFPVQEAIRKSSISKQIMEN